MRRLISVLTVALVVVLGVPAMASAQQSVSFSIGGFSPHGSQLSTGLLDGRSGGDVLTANSDFLAFNLKDFKNVTVNGEWLVGLGDMFEARRTPGPQPRATAEAIDEVMATLQVIHVRDRTATVKVRNVVSPDVPAGTRVKLVAKLPS